MLDREEFEGNFALGKKAKRTQELHEEELREPEHDHADRRGLPAGWAGAIGFTRLQSLTHWYFWFW